MQFDLIRIAEAGVCLLVIDMLFKRKLKGGILLMLKINVELVKIMLSIPPVAFIVVCIIFSLVGYLGKVYDMSPIPLFIGVPIAVLIGVYVLTTIFHFFWACIKLFIVK